MARWVEHALPRPARVRLEAVRLDDGSGELRLRLFPPELGEVGVTVRGEGARIQVQLHVQRPEVGAWLHEERPALQRALEQHGLQLAGFSVQVGQQQAQQPGYGQHPQPWAHLAGHTAPAGQLAAVAHRHSGTGPPEAAVSLGPSGLSLVDLRV
ncbi:MAG TPA: flagellar hook-length control protein FliK [Limnochordales bacterium]